jgi:hypothetical protein
MQQKVINNGKLFPINPSNQIILFFVYSEILEEELESVGIRLNRRKPEIYFKVLL